VTAQVLWTLVTVTWREKLTRPIAVALCLLLCVTQSALALSASHRLEDPVLPLALILGAGSIGRDLSSGVLALLFSRPIVRSAYVTAKWVATSLAAWTLSAATLVVQSLLLRSSGIDVTAAELLSALFESLSRACGVAAVLLPLSALFRGVGDVAMWVVLGLVGFLSQRVLPLRVSEEWRGVLQPSLGWVSTFGAWPIAWFALASYLSTITLCLCLAVLVLNRKDISYASG
jgi:ABC-type transport system involved in multi-copper enzyme maturation permease subunit